MTIFRRQGKAQPEIPSDSQNRDEEPARRSRGRPRSQAKVIDAALALIDEMGVKAVTMEGIADRAGISKITLYRNWPNRAALLAEALLARIRQTLPLDVGVDPTEAILGHATKFAAQLSGGTGDLLRAIIAEFLSDSQMMLDFREHYLGLRRSVAISLIKRGVKEREFLATGRPEILHDALYGAIFYRFLFCFGELAKADIRKLVDTILVLRR